jgi:hypothetical protein
MLPDKVLTYLHILVRHILRINGQSLLALVRLAEILALQRTGDGHFPLSPAANGTDIGLKRGTGTARAALAASFAQNWFRHAITKYYQIKDMKRVDLYIKVEVELEEDDTPEKVAREICRQVEKIYVVRKAELSSAVARD